MPVVPVLVVTLGLAVVLSPVAVLVHDARRTVAPSTEAARALRHAAMPAAVATTTLLLGVALVVVWGVGMPSAGLGRQPSGRLLAMLPLLAALAFLGVHAVGELTYPRPSGDVRTAGLAARRVTDVAPPRLLRVAHTWAALLTVALVAGSLTATGPRHLDRVVDGWISRGEPYPGTWFAVPLVLVTALVVLATHVVLHLVAARPAVGGVDAAWDAAVRRRAAARVLRGTQLALALTLAGVLLMASLALRQAASAMPALTPASASGTWAVAGWCLLGAALAVCVAGVGVAVRRGTPALPVAAAPVRARA